MAKQGQIEEAARQELLGELTGLRSANLQKDGTAKADAVPQELVRIKEIEKKLGIEPNAGMGVEPLAATSAPPQQPPPPPANETDAQKVKRLERENKELRTKAARSRDAQKIKTAGKKPGHVKRPDEIMNEALAIAEDTDPANWADNIKLSVERTIRRFVRKGGSRKNYEGKFYELAAGFKKGITLAEKMFALDLLNKLGRLRCPVEKIIKLVQDREKLTVSDNRRTNKEFNKKLEGLGVSWDDSIDVPGMSQTLRS